MKKSTLGFLALLGAGMTFGSFGILIRLLSKDLDSFQQIALRNTIGFILAVIIIAVMRASLSLNKVEKKHVFLYAVSYPLVIVFYTLGILHTKIAVAIFAAYAGSLPTATLLGIFFFHESWTRVKAVALGLVFVGLLFFVYPSFSTNAVNLGFLFGFLSGVIEAISNSFRKFLAGKIERFVLVAIQMLGGLVIAGALMLFSGSNFAPHMSTTTVVVGLVFGALLMTISFLTLVGFQYFDLGLGTLVVSSELFWGSIFALLAFGEFPDRFELIGGVFIIFAVIVSNYDGIVGYFARRKQLAAAPAAPAD